MPRCDWLQHCNFLAGIEILPFALQIACKPCRFATGRPAIVAGPVLRVAIGESCNVCRASYAHPSSTKQKHCKHPCENMFVSKYGCLHVSWVSLTDFSWPLFSIWTLQTWYLHNMYTHSIPQRRSDNKYLSFVYYALYLTKAGVTATIVPSSKLYNVSKSKIHYDNNSKQHL